MSTNFNWKANIKIPIEILPKKIRPFAQRVQNACASKEFDDEDILIHIGKRNAAGYYCYDCGTTLNKGGTTEIYLGNTGPDSSMPICPVCHAKYDIKKKTSVQGACSFTWTVMAHLELIKALAKPSVATAVQLLNNTKLIANDYGECFTAKEMLEKVKNDPIWFQSPYKFC